MIDLSGIRILLVEEEALIALLEEDALAQANGTVAARARTFAEASRLIETQTFDVALVDGTIGGIPAYQLADALRRKNIPFVILTAGGLYRRQGTPVHEFRDAVFVDKPFGDADLIQGVVAALTGGRAS